MKEGWEYKKLGDICKVLNGLWIGKKEPFVNVAVIRNTNFSKDCKLKLDDVAYIDVEERLYLTRKLQIGDIIIEKSGGSDKQPVGRPVLFNIPNGDFSFSNFTATLRLTDKSVNPQFLHRCLYGYYRNGETKRMQSKTTGLHNLDMKAYLRLLIPCLSIAEQLRIVSELDLLSSIIEKKKAQLNEYDQLAQSIFYDMFGEPIENSKGWGYIKLKALIEENVILYHLDGNHGGDYPRSEEFVNKGVPYIGANCISDGFVDFSLAKYLPKDRAYRLRKGLAKNEDVLFAHNASVGPVAYLITDEELVILSTSLTAFRCNQEKMNPLFLRAYMQSTWFESQYKLTMKQTTRNQVPITQQKNMDFILPPLTLQQSFASKIEAIERQKALIQQSITETETLFNSRMDYYFN